MQISLVQKPVRWVFAALYLATLTPNTATAGSLTRGCAARDLQVLMLIEERESASSISEQKTTEALLAIMNARMVCYDGNVVDALALYDNVEQSIQPITTDEHSLVFEKTGPHS
jgi:hypothetical protein